MELSPTAVSNADYCAFLNAVARMGDPYHLWNPLMAEHWWGGIEKVERLDGWKVEKLDGRKVERLKGWKVEKLDGRKVGGLEGRKDGGNEVSDDRSFVEYRVKDGYESMPVTCVTWESAARYCNWLSYGKPETGREELGTTEGDADCGVYDTRTFGTEAFVRSPAPVRRQSAAAYFLPTADEWRDAAFAGGDTGPFNVYDGHWARPFPHLSPVDEGSVNRLGYVNMLGNVGEWVESRRPGSNFFMALGGSLIRGKYSIQRAFIEGDESNKPISSFGFRVAHADKPVVLKVGRGERVPSTFQPFNHSTFQLFNPSTFQLFNPSTFQLTPLHGHNNWCRIGCPGNDRDPIYKVGRVDCEFEMAKYAVTNEDWCAFMNAVGYEKSLSLGLYNPDMTTAVCGGIDIIQPSNHSTFQPSNHSTLQLFNHSTFQPFFHSKPGYARRPVVYISYLDAMRYCNWLQTGDTERGAYDVATPSYHRLPGAKYFIPSDNEWCKAAYFDPTKLGARKYWDYPCRTSDLPPNDPSLPHACNYLAGDHLGEKGPYYLAEVESYPTSDTYFGCRQMAGNVWEWVEPVDAGYLNLRGTSFGYTEFGMGIWNRDLAGFADELNVFGLRIARAMENPKIMKPSWKRRAKDWLRDRLF